MATIKRGDIWYIESGFSTGSEQRPGRPAIVVSNDTNNYHSSTVEVVYLTTQPKHDLPTHVMIHSLSRESIAICEQITTVAVERMGSYRGRITEVELHDIETAMLVSLGMSMGCDVDVSEETPPCWKRASPKQKRASPKQKRNARFFSRCTTRCSTSCLK